MPALESCWRFLGALAAERPLAVEWCHRSATPTSGQLPAPLQQLGVGGRLVYWWKLWGGAHWEMGECLMFVFLLVSFSHAPSLPQHQFPCFSPCLVFNDLDVCTGRGGLTPSISLPSTPKTRSGTPVSVAGDGSATGGTKPWTPGLRCVLHYSCRPC